MITPDIMKIKRFFETIRVAERIPVSLNIYFAEVSTPTVKEKPFKKIYSKKYNDTMFRKYGLYKPISRMP